MARRIGSGDQALRFLETESANILPKGTQASNYTGESRQLRVEGTKFLPAFALALVLIFLVLAAQFNSFPRSVHYSFRLGAAGGVWRPALQLS